MNHTFSYFTLLLYKDFFAYTNEELHKMGLNFGQLPFLIYIGKFPGRTHSELTAALSMDWGHTQRCIARLVDSGYMHKERVGRSHELRLTEKGQEAFDRCHSLFFTWEEEMLRGLDEQERKTLLAGLEQVCRQSETIPKWDEGGNTK